MSLVLILVVVEDGLGAGHIRQDEEVRATVLILVVVEDGLGVRLSRLLWKSA